MACNHAWYPWCAPIENHFESLKAVWLMSKMIGDILDTFQLRVRAKKVWKARF